MSEETEVTQQEYEGQEGEKVEDEGIQKSVGVGLAPHPITSEMGLTLQVGSEQTWMGLQSAKRFIGEVDTTITTGISFGIINSFLSNMPAPPNKDLIVR